MTDPTQFQFDVFLSHNSKNISVVRDLAKALREQGIKVWFDEWELIPGQPWREALERIIETTKSAAVLIGNDGIGPWEDREMSGCLSEFVDRKMPVIPVLLPGCRDEPKLPFFLRQFTWVDLRDGFTKEGLTKLIWGIKGEKSEQESDDSMLPHKDERRSPIPWAALWRFLRKKALPIAVAVFVIGAVTAVRHWYQPATPPQDQAKGGPQSEAADSQIGRLNATGSQPSEQEDRTKVKPPVKKHSIVITMVPPFEDGNPNKLYPIEGTVGGVDLTACRVVVYAFDGQLWWIQPDTETPWTEIVKDGTWSTKTGAGIRYAALLVRNNAKLPTRTDKLPELSDYVLARYEKTSLLEERRLP